MYHLAIDIGASSGRHILGKVENGKLLLEEVYRFDNNIIKTDEAIIWDIEHLTQEVINGIKACKDAGKIPETVAIDTWGVDYVLLDENKKEIMPVIAYRDSRTNKAVAEVEKIIPPERLYAVTGIQKQPYNTIYQLYCDKVSGKMDKAKYFLMIPEYLSYKLTGVMKNEYTIASTSGMLDANTKTWSKEIIDTLGFKAELFGELSLPSDLVGNFSDEIKELVGFDAKVVFCPAHDTASAVAACPVSEKGMFISSGTWSLIGTENLNPILTDKAKDANYTNEGGIEFRFRFLKNIIGMWLFQSIRRELDKKYTYDEMMYMAEGSDFSEIVDVNGEAFLAPDSMIETVRAELGKPELPIEDVLACVYKSLATAYKNAVEELEHITGDTYTDIQVVGGGGSDKYLSRLTKEYTGKRIFTGLKEATSTGNIIAQILYCNKDMTLADCREIVKNSFSVTEVE